MAAVTRKRFDPLISARYAFLPQNISNALPALKKEEGEGGEGVRDES